MFVLVLNEAIEKNWKEAVHEMSFVKVSSTSELNAGEAISVTLVDENGVEKPVAVICDTTAIFMRLTICVRMVMFVCLKEI